MKDVSEALRSIGAPRALVWREGGPGASRRSTEFALGRLAAFVSRFAHACGESLAGIVEQAQRPAVAATGVAVPLGGAMRRVIALVLALAVAFAMSAALSSHVAAQPPGGGPGAPGGGPGGPGGRGGMGRSGMGAMGAPIDSFVTERDSLVKFLLANDYAGKESMPAESVFKNLKVVKGRTVQQVLMMMNFGFGRSLGVRCQHCHVLGHWADEDKLTKQVARDMMAMTGRINAELLPAIKNIQSEKPGVNCGTCHRGTARPGFGPMSGPGGGGGGGR